MSDEKVGGTIVIEIADGSIKYDTEMSLPEIVFWLDVVKGIIIKRVLDEEPI